LDEHHRAFGVLGLDTLRTNYREDVPARKECQTKPEGISDLPAPWGGIELEVTTSSGEVKVIDEVVEHDGFYEFREHLNYPVIDMVEKIESWSREYDDLEASYVVDESQHVSQLGEARKSLLLVKSQEGSGSISVSQDMYPSNLELSLPSESSEQISASLTHLSQKIHESVSQSGSPSAHRQSAAAPAGGAAAAPLGEEAQPLTDPLTDPLHDPHKKYKVKVRENLQGKQYSSFNFMKEHIDIYVSDETNKQVYS